MADEDDRKIRYAVVGLGHIAQKAVLPAFANTKFSELVGLVSGNEEKIARLAMDYGVKHCWTYKEYDRCVASGAIDAVFIALPNTMHEEYSLRALNRGKHVLCEKPLAMTSQACQSMIDAAQKNDCKLMTAYRLHFEEANLLAIKLLKEKRIGEPRFFSSTFSYQVKPANFRTIDELGGGPLVDIGVYCLNAARYLFKDDPIEVLAMVDSAADDGRFTEIDEMMAVTMRFPENRLAQFMCSFGAAPTVRYQVVGTEGDIVLENSYGYTYDKELKVTVGGKTETEIFPKTDQFAMQIDYFSFCIMRDMQPAPSGLEGMKDVRIMEAIVESAKKKCAVQIAPLDKKSAQSPSQS